MSGMVQTAMRVQNSDAVLRAEQNDLWATCEKSGRPMKKSISDQTLMADLAKGDPFALEFLYNRHRRTLYSAALRITGDPEGAEEVLQDALLFSSGASLRCLIQSGDR